MLLLIGDDAPVPSYDKSFMTGVLPDGLTYTNSSTTRTYFGSNGLLQTAAANVPIFEYDPVTLVLRGMRWEMDARTNVLLQSILPGGGAVPTGWTQPIATGTSAPVTSIFGGADGAVAYLQTASATRPFFNQAFSVVASTTYTVSMLVESVSGALLPVDVLTINGAPAGATITYPVCRANPSGGTASNIVTGELLLQLAVSTTAGSVGVRCGIGGNGAATGTLQFSRPQMEVGLGRSSFIATTTAAVTRAADVLTGTITPWYRQSEGTIVFEGMATEFLHPGDVRAPFGVTDGTANNCVACYFEAFGAVTSYIAAGGVVQAAAATVNTATLGAVLRIALAYKANSFGHVVNGGTVVTDTAGTVPTTTTLQLGKVGAGSPYMGYGRRFTYYPNRLGDSTIKGQSRV